LWQHSIIISIFAMGLLFFLDSFIIEIKKIKLLGILVFSFIGGIIISITFFPNSFRVVKSENMYKFLVQNIYLFLFLVLFDVIILIIIWYMQITSYSSFRNKKLGLLLNLNMLCFTILIITYLFYFIIQNFILRQFFLVFCIFIEISVLYLVVKKPDLFIELTSRIYDFIIFHRSGILLYTYNFKTNKNYSDTFVKGSILLGISHILTNFSSKKDQLNLIKMQDHDIILEFDNNLGIAILLITNKKNTFIERAVHNFMDKFAKINEENLTELNNSTKLVDISKFKNAKDIIDEVFSPYILKKKKKPLLTKNEF
ncbi:MAG: hypothetical protein ACFFAN_18985, partial [Promethearchaeota archaeon]